tara:strand:- start:266 stop:850 length:585 start_codon:yes stop_codon:yes gene_type:complete
MQKKKFLQLFLLSSIFIILVFFYKTYFVSKDTKNNLTIIEKSNNLKDDDIKNIIHNLKYFATSLDNNEYIITSKFGELSHKRPNIINMKNVTGTINYTNSLSLIITSDNATYNKINQDTHFFNNVFVIYGEHNIESKNLNLKFEENFVTITNDVIYNNLNTKLEADKIYIDLTTKDIKISTNNVSKKIRISNTN